MAVRRDGRRISWRRDDGLSGTATVASNDAAPPPTPSGLGLRPESASAKVEATATPAVAPSTPDIDAAAPVAPSGEARAVADAAAIEAVSGGSGNSEAHGPSAMEPAKASPAGAIHREWRLLEPPTPIKPPRFAVASLQPSVFPSAAPRREAPPPRATSPFGTGPVVLASDLLPRMADSWIAELTAQRWCHEAALPDGKPKPALVELAYGDLTGEGTASAFSAGCLGARPQLMGVVTKYTLDAGGGLVGLQPERR